MSTMELAVAKFLILPTAARGPFRVNRAGSTARQSLPVFSYDIGGTAWHVSMVTRTGHRVAAGQSFNCYRTRATIEGPLRFGEAECNIGDDFSSMELLCS
jgi:hypothetical protein